MLTHTAASLSPALSVSGEALHATPDCGDQPAPELQKWTLPRILRVVGQHVAKHTGVGIVCAVAYFDPRLSGNWGVDLQAGSEYGYKLLFVVLLAGLFAVYMQVLASRLGCVTGLDLASHCRLLLHDRPRHTLLWRWLVLYPLYALAEVAIISTDLAELLGSAMALCMLFPKLDVWAGVLITTADVFLLLAVRNPIGGQPVRAFEVGIAALVFTVLVCMAVIISKTEINWGAAFDGFVPSKTLFQSGGLYTSIGIIGATVMPHSLFLGSALATQDRVSALSAADAEDVKASNEVVGASTDAVSHPQNILKSVGRSAAAKVVIDDGVGPRTHADWVNRPLAFVQRHLCHGIVDMVVSLLGLAVVINAMILILASAVFFYGPEATREGPATLFDAYDLLHDRLGAAAATLFALALLASGQSSSIIATLAAQIVSEGFIRWHLSPVMTRLLTRSLGLVPSLVVAIAVGRPGISTLLVASQVVLSIVLPFVTLPLIYFTSSKRIMAVRDSGTMRISASGLLNSTQAGLATESQGQQRAAADDERTPEMSRDLEGVEARSVDFSNGKVMVAIGIFIWVLIVAANVYAVVGLAMGQGG
ncbi:natural resistance-associated macrophage protein-domain-containing protein [Earliella scabrosa]|nr:natural resistance-associated macrophage protein-domain-containing protein [Earliella scabrosa]